MPNSVSEITKSNKFYEALSLISKIENKINLEDYMRDNLHIDFKKGSYKDGSPVYMCNCPIHNENTPSFALYTHNQTFYCFGCKESGGLITFVQKLNKWTWFQTINYFASKLNISCTFTEQDVLDMLENTYNIAYQSKIDEYNPININYYVSTTCRDLIKEIGEVKDIIKYIDQIYKFTDKAIISKDRASLFKIKEELMPALLDKVKSYKDKKKLLEKINLENSNCSKCFLRHQTNKIIIGNGNIYSPIMIILENPNINQEKLINLIEKNNFNSKDIYYEFMYNCSPKNDNFYFKEGSLCKKNWLMNKIKILNPKAIMVLGESACKIFLDNQNVKLENYLGRIVPVEDIKTYFNYSVDDEANQENFEKLLYNFLNIYLK